nr:cupin-like domain-containing protein [Caulobacter vibrioides]
MTALTARRTLEVTAATPAEIPFDAVLAGQTPMLFKGLVRDWPLVQAGLGSPQAARDYIRAHDRGVPVVGYTGDPAIKGRFFYNDALTGLNFKAERAPLEAFLGRIEAVEGQQNAQINFVRGRANEYVGRLQLLAQVGTLEVGNLAPGVQPYDPERNFRKVRYRGALPTELIIGTFDKIALPLEPKKPAPGDTSPIRPPSSELPARPVSADKVTPPASMNDLPALTDDTPVQTAPRN